MEIGFYFEEYTDDWSFTTDSVTITDEMITAFVDLCGYNTPTFRNPDYASKQYKGRMAPGMFVMSLADGLCLNAGITRRRGIFAMEYNPKILKPTYAGDTITNFITLKSKRLTSKPDRGVVVTNHDVRNQNGETVISYTSTRMIRTREFVEAT